MSNSLLLTIGALLLFGLFLVSGNRKIVEGKIASDASEYTITAVSLAQSLIDEAKLKAVTGHKNKPRKHQKQSFA
jgi:hypothetical protein